MTPQTQTESKPKSPEATPHRRLSVVYFHRSVVLCGSEQESAALPPKDAQAHRPGNSVDLIERCWIGEDGEISTSAEFATRPPDGLVFRKRSHDNVKNVRVIAQTFVPWSNIRCVTYGAE